MTAMKLKNKKIIVTGASFIGIHLVKRLLNESVSKIGVVNLTTRILSNCKEFIKDIEFKVADLRSFETAKKMISGHDIVIHLAADHGGRGYIDLQQGNTASNFLLDGSVFKACLEENIEKIFYASSGCVYPNYLQKDITKKLYLKEGYVKPPYDADNIYGWAKLMGELTLKQYYKDFGLKSAIGRFFTVYGPYARESHSVIATIAKAFIHQDPFEVWGGGGQIRNWTYVDDIVNGIVLALEHVENGLAINMGTSERITVDNMVSSVLKKMNFIPRNIKHISMPTGPLNRVADMRLAKKVLGWEPQMVFETGLKKTIEWYTSTHEQEYVKSNLQRLLLHH